MAVVVLTGYSTVVSCRRCSNVGCVLQGGRVRSSDIWKATWLHLYACAHEPLPSTAFVCSSRSYLAYGYSPLQMVVMWSTESSSSTVLYGRFAYDLVMKECREFTKGNLKDLQYVHSGSAGIGHSTTRLGLFF